MNNQLPTNQYSPEQAKWLELLKSKTLPQASNLLKCQLSKDICAYCCLGVAMDLVFNVSNQLNSQYGDYAFHFERDGKSFKEVGVMPSPFYQRLGLYSHNGSILKSEAKNFLLAIREGLKNEGLAEEYSTIFKISLDQFDNETSFYLQSSTLTFYNDAHVPFHIIAAVIEKYPKAVFNNFN